jgi:hypothetical protein
VGDYYERIVDLEVTGEEAADLAERTVAWLVAEGVITRETSGAGMYSVNADEGYLPGPRWERAVADAGDPSWQPGPVAVVAGRNYFVGGQGADEAEYASCPHCGTRTVITDYPEEWEPDEAVWRPFRQAVDAWRRTGEGGLACTACGEYVAVTEWGWDSSFAVGALALEFWGWPPLAESFCAGLGARWGHRTARHMGKF